MNSRSAVRRSLTLLVAVIALSTLIGSALLMRHASNVDNDNQLDTALAAARSYSDSISAFRRFYIDEVSPSDEELEFLAAESPHTRLAELTDPYSRSIDLAEQSASEFGRGRYRVYSEFPWPMREGARNLNEAEQKILHQLTAGGEIEAVEIVDEVDGRRLYLGTPIVMEQSCVACHNNHPRSPAKGWAVGDVRGIQTVEVMLPKKMSAFTIPLAKFPTLFGGYLVFLAVVIAISATLGQWMISRVRDDSAQGILDSLGEAVMGVDGNQILLSMNTAGQDLFGYTEDEVIGKPLSNLVRVSGINPGLSESSAVEGTGERRDGSEFSCSVLTRPDRRGPNGRSVISVRDITEETRVRKRLLESSRVNTVGRLAAGIAHEFNNLLAVILSNTELARENVRSGRATAVDNLEQVLSASERGSDLIGSLVASTSNGPEMPRQFSARELVESLQPAVSAMLGPEIRQSSTIDKATMFYADPGRIEDAVIALIARSIELSPNAGSLELHIGNASAKISEILIRPISDTPEASGKDGRFSDLEVDLEFAAIRNLVQLSGGELRVDTSHNELVTVTIFLPSGRKA